MNRRQVAAVVVVGVVAFGFVRLASSLAELDKRVAGSLQWDAGTWAWGYRTPKVAALAALLEKAREAVPPRSLVAVEGEGFADHEEFLIHWTQFLAPELDIVLRRDLPAGVEPAYVLELGRNAKGAPPGEVVVQEPIGRLMRAR